MDPFVLSRNAFNIYCSEYISTNLSSSLTNNNTNQTPMNIDHSSDYSLKERNCRNEDYENAVQRLNQRYQQFLRILDRLQISFEQTTKNHNINSVRNSEIDTLTLPSQTSKRSNKKRLYKSNQRRMPKVHITVLCAEHRTQQRPNIKIK